MDINDLRVATTVAGLVAFLAILAWAWSRKRHTAFDEAAHLPFGDEQHEGAKAQGDAR